MTEAADRRLDNEMAGHIAQGLTIAALFGFESARRHLRDAGVPDRVAQELLYIRYERRQRCLDQPASLAPAQA
jgi:hypothetical protein